MKDDRWKEIPELIVIEDMKTEDIEEVAQLEKEIFSIPWSSQGFLSSLRQPDTLYLTVRAGGRLVGYCGLLQSFDEADITNVAVCSDFRARGIGRRMLEALMERGRERGIERYTLEVRVSNEPAIRLYHRLGFEDAGIRKNFYEKPSEDALIMWTRPV
ncbi:MAG: ribosomal protein S18-alanine N-acetyltransferase [Lachnospiraceae bacterium]|uniref:ribosomal protein S18-alanine N-acetyltransferase n=1 Tax=Parablautia sp. Marseille-Q6255 TaxID=3039593 RepID=UPI0024BD4972|nr:ribosomal protein S18-alanine N-acetyltransferase [Parablautia sp. Marseille-Q6255]